MDWTLELGVDDQRAAILWLYGPAGSRKSAIVHDIAHRCNLGKLLLVFSHSDPARSNTKSFIMTIANQIAVNVPGTQEKIVGNIKQDPLILTESLEAQVSTLIVEPLHDS